MISDVFTDSFVQQLIMLAVTTAVGAVALLTWQRAYWLYQVRKQTDDWKQRQTHSRKDSRRQAMENLLVDLNQATEKHLTATYLAASAIVRSSQARTKSEREEWQPAVNESVAEFNASERAWLVEAAVLGGKLRLHFGVRNSRDTRAWSELTARTVEFCNSLNEGGFAQLLGEIEAIRDEKDALLIRLQHKIDRFTLGELQGEEDGEQT